MLSPFNLLCLVVHAQKMRDEKKLVNYIRANVPATTALLEEPVNLPVNVIERETSPGCRINNKEGDDCYAVQLSYIK